LQRFLRTLPMAVLLIVYELMIHDVVG